MWLSIYCPRDRATSTLPRLLRYQMMKPRMRMTLMLTLTLTLMLTLTLTMVTMLTDPSGTPLSVLT